VKPTLRELLASARPGDTLEVAGWVRSARHAKERSFLDLVDGSDIAGLQLVAEPELENFESSLVVRRRNT
jgi:asparaginyl-tRNA synthetase